MAKPTRRALRRDWREEFRFTSPRNLQDCIQQWFYPNHVRETVTVKGLENLEAALEKGRGVIALGAHIGNFIFAGARLGMDGYAFHTLFRIPADQWVRELIQQNLSCFHQKLIPAIPRKAAVRRVLDVLRNNEIVFILADNLKRGRVNTRFFGQPVLSSRGPVSLALRSGAAVVPIYVIRNYGGRLDLVIDPEIPVSRNGNLSGDIVTNTHRITLYLEGLVRRYPDQWSWLTVRMRGDNGGPVVAASTQSSEGLTALDR